MTEEEITLCQTALLVGVRHGDPRRLPALLKRDVESWSLVIQQKDELYWKKLPAKKPFTNLSRDICQQQTEFLIWEMQRCLQLKTSHQTPADFLKPHPVTRQQNMRFVFTYFNMQGPSPFRRPDYRAAADLLSSSPLFPRTLRTDQLSIWMLQLKQFFALLVPPQGSDDEQLVSLVEDSMATIGKVFKLSSSLVWECCVKARRRYEEDICSVAPLSIKVIEPVDCEHIATSVGVIETDDETERRDGAKGNLEPERASSVDTGARMIPLLKTLSKRPSSNTLREQLKKQRLRSDEESIKHLEQEREE
ncbi:hypothetical protein MMC13_001799 [Lambiella insularis]|nr:hypothetical protein [Lambiella insularis]